MCHDFQNRFSEGIFITFSILGKLVQASYIFPIPIFTSHGHQRTLLHLIWLLSCLLSIVLFFLRLLCSSSQSGIEPRSFDLQSNVHYIIVHVHYIILFTTALLHFFKFLIIFSILMKWILAPCAVMVYKFTQWKVEYFSKILSLLLKFCTKILLLDCSETSCIFYLWQ